MTATTGTHEKQPGRVRALIVRFTGMEKIVYIAIGRAITRRPWKAPDAQGFGYHAQTFAIMIVFVVVSGVEIIVMDLILHRWIWARIPVLIVGIWGLIWMIGATCAFVMRPHTVGREGIRVRGGIDQDVLVTWDDVYSVALKKRTFEPRTPTVIDGDEGRALVMDVTDQTNIEVVLERPTVVRLPGLPPKGGDQVINRIYLWADEPKGFLVAVGNHISSEPHGSQAEGSAT